jgi:hypothetical protein
MGSGPAAALAWRFERGRTDGGGRRLSHQATIRGRLAIVPIISGRAWITGVSQYMLDPADPWPSGYRLSETWPRIREAI